MSGCKIDGGLNIKDSIVSANCHLHGNNKDKTKKDFLAWGRVQKLHYRYV